MSAKNLQDPRKSGTPDTNFNFRQNFMPLLHLKNK